MISKQHTWTVEQKVIITGLYSIVNVLLRSYVWMNSFLFKAAHGHYFARKCAGISVVIAVGVALVIIVYATLFVVCVLFIRKYDLGF